MTYITKNLHFCNLKKCVTDRRNNGRTDGRTDRRTDRPFYRDARTHLKMKKEKVAGGRIVDPRGLVFECAKMMETDGKR